jgi:hypothetical protein
MYVMICDSMLQLPQQNFKKYQMQPLLCRQPPIRILQLMVMFTNLSPENESASPKCGHL